MRLFAAIIGLLIFSGCKKENKGSDGNSPKQAYSIDLTGSYSPTSGNNTAMVIRVQNDGKILVLGYQWFIRLEQDGVTIDNTFNPVSELASSAKVKSFELQNDGKIIVFGSFVLSNGRTAIIRLNSDGSIDNSFNIPALNFNYSTAMGTGIRAIKLLGNGKMIVAGQFEYGSLPTTYGIDIARLNTDQSVDNSFSSPIGYGDTYGITNILLLENGNFLLAGYGAIQLKDGLNYNVVRINADGVYDPSFIWGGNGGSVIVGDMKELPDGKILIGGSLNITFANSLTRINPNGDIDNSFNAYGFNETLESLLVSSDNNILLGFNPNANLPTESQYLNLISSTGIQDTTFHLDLINASVWCLVNIDDSTILAGGNFTLNNKNYAVIRLKKR